MKFLEFVTKYKFALIAAALVVTVVVAAVLYNTLSDKYRGGGLAEIPGGGTDEKPSAGTEGSQGGNSGGESEGTPDGGEGDGEGSSENGGAPEDKPDDGAGEQKPDEGDGENGTPNAQKPTLEYDFSALDYEGNTVKLSDYVGKPVVLNFWATWCGYCKQEMADFNKAAKDLPNVTFLMVNATDGVSETVASAKKYIESQGFDSFNVLFDTKSEAQIKFRVNGYPTTFFIDETGTPRLYASGAINYDIIINALNQMAEK